MSLDEYDITITQGSEVPGRRLNNPTATSAPTVTDDADSLYEVMSIWLDTSDDLAYICIDATAGAAVWARLGPGASDRHNIVVMDPDDADPPTPVLTTDGTGYVYAEDPAL
jgi:hypothetical protein